jgi:hypothetical protein
MGDFLSDAHHFALESITSIALDSRLGCFEERLAPDLQRYIDSMVALVRIFPQLLIGFPWWKVRT